jgi:MFS family permease
VSPTFPGDSADEVTATTVPAAPLPAGPVETLTAAPAPPLPRVSARYIWLQVLGQGAVFIAFITPIAISLAVRLGELAPGHQEYLGFITGAGAFWVLLTSPLIGTLSDRTRSRLGRRRPFMLIGMLIGVVSLVVMALAPSVFVLGLGWILAQAGWGTTLAALQNMNADVLPEEQRGKVAGLTGVSTQIGPVVGVILASGFTRGQNLAMFLVPGAVGVVVVLLYVLLIKEQDSRGNTFAEPLTLRSLFGRYLYNPRRFPDFSWNWVSRFAFYFGITLSTTFSAYFFAQKLGISVAEIGGLVATLGGAGVLATTLGAIGGGFLSDRLKRRRVFVLAAAIIFGVGAMVMAFAPGMPVLIVGSLLTSVGIGAYAAIDQALLLDVLPEKETEAGRYMGITGFATSIPQAVAPLVASALLVVGVSGADKNYTLLYVAGAVITVAGALAVLRIRAVR